MSALNARCAGALVVLGGSAAGYAAAAFGVAIPGSMRYVDAALKAGASSATRAGAGLTAVDALFGIHAPGSLLGCLGHVNSTRGQLWPVRRRTPCSIV